MIIPVVPPGLFVSSFIVVSITLAQVFQKCWLYIAGPQNCHSGTPLIFLGAMIQGSTYSQNSKLSSERSCNGSKQIPMATCFVLTPDKGAICQLEWNI